MIDRYEVYKYYQTGDIFVCASTSESQGLTYVEALSSGLPLVCRRDDCLVGVFRQREKRLSVRDRDRICTWGSCTSSTTASLHIICSFIRSKMQRGFGAETFGRRMEQLYLDVLSGEI